MNTRITIVLALLLICVAQSACGISPAEKSATATQAAAQAAAASFATQTAQAPTGTPTYTSSPTVTPSPTATATPTPTLKPTNTSTITPTATPQWMGAGLVLEDLPEGFQPMQEEELSYLRQGLPPDSLAFGFGDEAKSQAVMGYYLFLPTRADQLAFDGMLQATLDYLASSMGATGKSKPIHVQDDVGDARLASTFVLDQNGFKSRLDMILFRRGEVAAFLFVLYPDGDKPVVRMVDLARLLDGRIQDTSKVIPSSSTTTHISTGPNGIRTGL